MPPVEIEPQASEIASATPKLKPSRSALTRPSGCLYCTPAVNPHLEEETMGKGDYTIKTSQRRRQRRLKKRMKRIAETKRTERAARR